MDLTFDVDAKWAGVGREGEGEMHIGDHHLLPYSAPDTMGGKGVGASPETLLLAAVTACYSGTLMRVLEQRHLPGVSVSIHTHGVVEGYPQNAKFARIIVNPVIQGGDPDRIQNYKDAAQTARDRCFIGRAVRDYLTYEVGDVTLEDAESRM